MAEDNSQIKLDFGVDKGTSKINIEEGINAILKELPTFGIKVGVNDESLKTLQSMIDSIKEQFKDNDKFNLNLGGANVAIQSAGELDEAIKRISTDLSNITNIQWTKWDDSKEVLSFGEVLQRIYRMMESIKGTASGLSSVIEKAFRVDPKDYSSAIVNFKEELNNITGLVNNLAYLMQRVFLKNPDDWSSYIKLEEQFDKIRLRVGSVLDEISKITTAFGSLDNTDDVINLNEQFNNLRTSVNSVNTEVTTLKENFQTVFRDLTGDSGLAQYITEMESLRNTVRNSKTEVYGGSAYLESSFTGAEAEKLTKITAGIELLTEKLLGIPEILTQISALIDTISKKEFSVTNNFTGNLENLKDKTQETRLYRDRLLELYKVVREYNTEAERMASTRYVNGEANRIFQQISGTGMSNIFEMIQQLDELGVSERSIYSMSNMKSIEAKMGRLNELKTIYETLFQEVQKYQQTESNSALAKSGFKINAPDMTAFQKATEALDTYQNKITEIKAAAADAAAKQLSSNQDKERLEAAKQIAAVVEQSLATPQQQLNEIQTKLTETFDLSKISPNAEKITQTLSGIDQQLGNIKTQIRTTFDLSGVDFNTSKITAGTDIIKSRLTEIQNQIGSIFDPSKINPEAMNQMATAARNAVNLTGENLDTSKFTAFTTEVSQQLVRIQNQIRNTFNTSNLVIDTAKFDDFTRHVFSELVRTQNQLRETFNGAKLVVDTARVGDFTTEAKRQIAEVKAEIAKMFDLSDVTFDYSKFDEFTNKVKEGFTGIRMSVKSSLDGIKAYIDEVSVAYANLLVHIDKAANNPVIQKVAEMAPATTTQTGTSEATQRQTAAVHELAQAHTELAQATEKSTTATKNAKKASDEQAMSWKTKQMISQALFTTQRQLGQLIDRNAKDESAELDHLIEAYGILSEAANKVKEDFNSIEYIFKREFGKTADYLTRVRTDMLAYEAQVLELGSGGHVTESQFYTAISSMKNIQALYPDKAGLAVYDQIIERLKLFSEAEADVKSGIVSVDEALNMAGLEGRNVIEDVTALIKQFKAEITGETPILKLHEQIAAISGAIKTAKNSGKDVLNSEQFKNMTNIMELFNKALNETETNEKSVNQAFEVLGTTTKEAFDAAKIAASDLRTLLNETEKSAKVINASELERSITKMQSLDNKAEKSDYSSAKRTEEYRALVNQLYLARQALELVKQDELTADEALKQYGSDGVKYISDLERVINEFNIVLKDTEKATIRANNADKAKAKAAQEAAEEQRKLNQMETEALRNAKQLKDAYLQVLTMQSQMVTAMNSASKKNSALEGTSQYQAVQGYLAQFKDAVTAMTTDKLNIKEAFEKVGGEFENSVLRAKEAMSQLKLVTGETEKEVTEAEPKITSLAKAYDALARANRLLQNNADRKGTAEYTALAANRDEMQRVVDLVEKGVRTIGGYRQVVSNLDEAFTYLNVDGEQTFENLRVAASRFNNEIAKTDKSISLDRAYNKLRNLTNLLNGKKGKTLVGTDEYNAVQNAVNQLAEAIGRAENKQLTMNQAFEQMGVVGKDALAQMDLAATKMQSVLDNTQVTDIKSVWNTIQSAQRILDKNQSMSGDISYQKLESNIKLMSKAIEEARKNGTTLDVQLQQMGVDGQKAFEDIKLGVLDFQAAMRDAGVSGTTTEVKLERAMNSLKKLQADADKYQGRSFNLNGSPAVIEQTEQYTKLQAQIQIVAKALELMRNSGLSADEALTQLGTTGTELFSNIELNSVRMKGAIDQVTQAYKNAKTGTRVANQEEKKRQELIAKAYSLMSKSQKISANWTMAATGKSADSYRQIQGYANALGNLISQFKNGSMTAADFERQLATIDAGLKQGTATIQAAGENAASLSLKLNNVFQRFSAWFGATRIIMKVITSIKQMISTSIELDDAFTQLQIVTKDTEASYESFGSTVAKIARETAVSMKDITDAATTFARLGYNLEDAAKLAEYTAKLQNVGDIETQEAQDAITSILKAYDDVDAEHIEEVMDKLVVTGNNFPISVSQIAEGMTNASSALAAAGNTFDQSVALLTAANTTLQDAAKSSTALRTITARLRRTDSELDELGESMESSKYDKLIKSLTDLDIALVDANNEYRSTYDIMADIAGKWDSLTSMEQAALAETIAGTRQQAAFFSIISNFQEASGAMDAMANSAGTLEEAYGTYLDSTTAHINQFKAAFEELGANTFKSEFLSNMVDLGTAFTGFVNALVKAKALIPALGIGAILLPQLGKMANAAAASSVQVTKLSASLVKEKAVNDELTISLAALNAEELKRVETNLYVAVSTGQLTYEEYKDISAKIQQIAATGALTKENVGLAASFRAVAAAIPGWGWVLISITAVVGALGFLSQKVEESRQAFADSTSKVLEQTSALEKYKKTIQEIAESSDTQAEKLEKLNEIRETINDAYGTHIEKINDETKAMAALNEEIERQIVDKRDLYLSTNKAKYNDTVKKAEDFLTEDSLFGIIPVGGKNQRTIQQNGSTLFDLFRKQVNENNVDKDILSLFSISGLAGEKRFSIGETAKNEIELLKVYENTIAEFEKLNANRTKLGEDLTSDEQVLFDNLIKGYENLKEELGENGIDYENTILPYAEKRAEQIIAANKQGTKSLVEWREELFKVAEGYKGSDFIKDKIMELTTVTEEAGEVAVDVLAEIQSEMDKVQSKLDSLDESMQAAKDIFEDLAKTIKTNNDADKFFSSAEIIDLLDKYPELSNAILETSYGYKIEADALEELRQMKLAEQKDALASQITETESAIESVQKRLDAYASEIQGVQSLAEAKVKLASTEAMLAKLSGSNNAAYSSMQKALEERRKALAGWVDTAAELDNLKESLQKSKMQYTVLGKVFDDVADKSNDVSKALTEQKNKLKDLADDYKDAQDKINDLIKLTMDYLKKEANLRKEALKEQLDAFKKLIDKRKELIDLEKEQYDFEKDLKEQNRDLLAIQQELDALSVEGADYSLEDMKRKAELQQKFNEQSEKRTDFLYDHEVDLRKDALDREEKAFEENINTQTKAIEDYLAHEGWIRAEAIDLINSKSQEFYDNLLNYTQNYTDMAQWEFQNLWNSAYEALMKYGNGAIDVDYTLAYLAGRIAQMDAEMEALENQINNTKNAAQSFTDGFTDGMEGVVKVTEEAIKKMGELQNVNLENTSWSAQAKDPRYYDTSYTSSYMGNNSSGHAYWPMSDKLKSLVNTKYHDGGLVKNNGKLDGSEILAKLMTGEVVVTPEQANTFIGSTLPKMITASSITNNSAPTVSIGDINIAGDATESTVTKIKQAQKEIVDNVFKVINNQRRLYTGINI